MLELELTMNCVDLTPLRVTDVTPRRLAPWMVTWVPTGPDVGVNAVIWGGPESTVTVVDPLTVRPVVLSL